MMDRVAGKAALITGAANGIGKAIATRLAEEGSKVAVCDIADKAGEQAAATLREAGAQAIFIHHDAGDEASWRAALQQAIGAFGGLDILVNNAYAGAMLSIDAASLEDLVANFRVTANGVFLGIKLAAPLMPNGGAIVNIASTAAHGGSPGHAVYGAAKSAVISFSRSAALELAGRRIRVNIVTPGPIVTPSLLMTVENMYNVSDEAGVQEGLKRLGRTVPLGRVGDPRDIANAVLFLASDEASFVTGAELMVDGGWKAR